MSATDVSAEDRHEPRFYEIRLKGHLHARWATSFESLSFTYASDGTTILAGPVVDQAALYGLLRTVRDLGLPLVSVMEVEPGPADRPDRQHGHRSQSFEQGDKHMNTRKLIRWAGISAMVAGIIFAGIQPIHPPDVLASVTTTHWAIIQSLKTAMCIFGLLGLTGLYARQANEAGWLGLAGYLLFSLFFALTLPLAYTEAFILPLLATEAPMFVEGFLGIFNGRPVQTNLGALPVLYNVAGFAGYVLGGLLFGIATLRAGVLPRRAAGLLAVGAVATLGLAMLPHPLDRIAAVPVGLSLAWLGYALWLERREHAAEPVPGRGIPQLRQTAAE